MGDSLSLPNPQPNRDRKGAIVNSKFVRYHEARDRPHSRQLLRQPPIRIQNLDHPRRTQPIRNNRQTNTSSVLARRIPNSVEASALITQPAKRLR